MPYSEKKNCFDRFIFKTRIVNVAVAFAFLGGIALIILGTVVFKSKDFGGGPTFGLMVPGIFLAFACLPGSLIPWLFRHNTRVMYEKLKLILTEEEIAEITRVSFVDTAILKKAQRLQKEGEAKKDMAEYENFRQLVAMAGFSRVIMTQSVSAYPPRF